MTTGNRIARQIGVLLLAGCFLIGGGVWLGRTVESQQSGSGQPLVSLSAATTGTGVVIATGNSAQVAWSIIYSTGVSAGEVVIESADSMTYAGTWNELDRQPFTANAMFSGTYPGPIRFVRARVSTGITGGTVTAQFNRLIR